MAARTAGKDKMKKLRHCQSMYFWFVCIYKDSTFILTSRRWKWQCIWMSYVDRRRLII